jgi:hypothetical protein
MVERRRKIHQWRLQMRSRLTADRLDLEAGQTRWIRGTAETNGVDPGSTARASHWPMQAPHAGGRSFSSNRRNLVVGGPSESPPQVRHRMPPSARGCRPVVTSTSLAVLHKEVPHTTHPPGRRALGSGTPDLELAHPRDVHLGLGDERVVGGRWRRGDAAVVR